MLAGILSIFIIVFVCVAPHAHAETEKKQEQQASREQPPDSLRVYPEKIPSTLKWEKIVNVPGRIIHTPFLLAFIGAAKIAEEIDDTKIIPKAKYYYSVYWPEGFSVKYSSRHGGGLSYSNKFSSFHNTSRFDVTVQRGKRDRGYYGVRLIDWRPFGKKYSTDLTFYNRFLSDESYFGLGNETKFSGESNYALNQSVAEMSFKVQMSPKFNIGARLGFDINDVEKGRDSDLPYTTDISNESDLPGLEEKTRTTRVQIELKYNSINRMKRPTEGLLFFLNGGLSNDLEHNDYAFRKFSAGYRQFFHLKYNRTFSLRFAFERTQPFSGNKVPFYYLSELGETETIRGFRRGRFRDNDMLLGSFEYRYPIWREWLDAGLFIDAGQVSPNILERFSGNDFHYGYGGALKIWGKDSQKMQLMVGRSSDMTRYYFSWNEEF
ncbi:BamA/TamA family outer membrane protein [Candidatus Latescibacterota bacterium]